MEAFVWFVAVIFSAVAASHAASSKRRSDVGWFFLGLLVGPLALLGLAACGPAGIPCTKCAERIGKTAAVCPWCATPSGR